MHFKSDDESFKDKTLLLLLWHGSLVTLNTAVFIHRKSAVKPIHIALTRSKTSKRCLMVELCLHLFVHFGCVAIYAFGFTTSSKEYLNNLDTKKVTDNKTVWRTVVPTFSNKNSKSNKIILNEESKTISDEKELCRTFSTYFANIVSKNSRRCV